MIKIPMEIPNPLFGLILYPEAKRIMEEQQDATWTALEVPVEKDKQDYLVNMSVAQHRLSSTTLTIFVELEQAVGDIWLVIASWFPHSEIEGACLEIARMEKAVHAFFYQKMSDVLNIDPEDTLKQQQEIKTIRDKLTLIKRITSNPSANKRLTLATLAAIEQVLLFSNFAMLKSFKANGHNLIKNTLLGVDYVIDDEQLHGVLATYLHNTYIIEASMDITDHIVDVHNVMSEIVHHEDRTIDYSFGEAESINDITPTQLKVFIRSRANDTLAELGLPELFAITAANPIADWFYQGTKSIKVHDFFSAGTNKYKRTWGLDSFSRLPHMEAEYAE